MEKQRYGWLWLLLFLLPALLLPLRFSKDIRIVVFDKKNENNIGNVKVGLKFVDYSIVRTNPLRFFVADTVIFEDSTLKDGMVAFTDVNYSFYSVVFHPRHKVEISASAYGMDADTAVELFSILQDALPYRMGLERHSEDLYFRVLDSDDFQPLASAEVEVMVDGNVKKLLTSPAGGVLLPNTAVLDSICIIARMPGYVGDTIFSDVLALLEGVHNRTLLLKPCSGIVSLAVQDADNEMFVPGVSVSAKIGDDTLRFFTNVNGVGKGLLPDADPGSSFSLLFSHVSYSDTSSKVYKISEFERLRSSSCLYRMRRMDNGRVFRVVDSLSHRPVSGAEIEVFLNEMSYGTLFSDGEGCFTIGNIGEKSSVELVLHCVNYRNQQVKLNGRDVIGNNQSVFDVVVVRESFSSVLPEPRNNCGVHFSGTLLGGEASGNVVSKVYEPDSCGEYVGPGRYRSMRAAFPNAMRLGLNAIAVDRGTHLIVFSRPNFEGDTLLDVHGPCLINNVDKRHDSRISNFMSKHFPTFLEINYPPQSRRWSDSNMQAWQGSAVVEGERD